MRKMDEIQRMKALVERLSAQIKELSELSDDDSLDNELGPPTPPERIAELERRRNIQLPDDYRAFLLLHDGWRDFSGEQSLLSVDEMTSGELFDFYTGFQREFREPPKPDEATAVGFVFEAAFSSSLAYFDIVGRDGTSPLEVVKWSRGKRRFPSFTAYLEDHSAQLAELIEREKKNLR